MGICLVKYNSCYTSEVLKKFKLSSFVSLQVQILITIFLKLSSKLIVPKYFTFKPHDIKLSWSTKGQIKFNEMFFLPYPQNPRDKMWNKCLYFICEQLNLIFSPFLVKLRMFVSTLNKFSTHPRDDGYI